MNAKKMATKLTKTSFVNHLYAIAAIASSLMLGKLINAWFGGLPSSLYGMVIIAILLKFNVFSPKRIQPTVSLIIATMGVCFVPAGVGVMDNLPLLMDFGLLIVLMVISTTFIVITLVGYIAQQKFNKQKKSQESVQ